MKKASLMFAFFLTYVTSFSQPVMVAKMSSGLTHFGFNKKMITKYKKVPSGIRAKADSLLQSVMGDFYTKTSFYYGDIYVSTHKSNPKVSLSTPKYDLLYILNDKSLGIESLPINLRLDDDGKPLKLTWPRKGYTNSSIFISRDTIKQVALQKAKELNYNTTGYEIEFKYDETGQKFYWQFLFPIKESDHKDYRVFEISWADKNDFKSNPNKILRRQTVY